MCARSFVANSQGMGNFNWSDWPWWKAEHTVGREFSTSFTRRLLIFAVFWIAIVALFAYPAVGYENKSIVTTDLNITEPNWFKRQFSSAPLIKKETCKGSLINLQESKK